MRIIPAELVQRFLDMAKYYQSNVHHFIPEELGSSQFSVIQNSERPLFVYRNCNVRALECPITTKTEGCPLRRIVVKIISRDQGWWDNSAGGAWSWFDIVLERPEGDIGQRAEIFRRPLLNNFVGEPQMTTHLINIGLDHPIVKEARSNDVVSIWICARFPGWENVVQEITVWTFTVYEVDEI
jgi:hypothetical protein